MMKKILVIDDDEGIKDALKAMLELDGFEVDLASDEKKLLQTKEKLPGLILLDFFLSGKTGKSIAQNIRRHALTKNIPIIMLSADPNNRNKVKKNIANDFLEKPFEMNDLLSLANKYLPSVS